ncbi:MAG: heme biosynthesis HemY N-terminal domain-containing protein [bacterium]
MIRLFLYLLSLIAAAYIISIILGLEGSMTGRFEGQEYHIPINVLLVASFLTVLATGLVTWLLSYLMRLPEKIKRRKADTRRTKGLIALSRGLEAVAAGDPEDAMRYAKTARKQLDAPNLTRLLTAQAAQLSGDHALVEQSYTEMLEAPETEFLGLRGLYLQAITEGDSFGAKEYADRAFRLRPNAEWAFKSVYDLSLERGAWGEAKQALTSAARNGVIDSDNANRKEAVLLTAAAYTAEASGDTTGALKDISSALKLSPEFAPAATLAAKLYQRQHNTKKAAKIIETAWAHSPHPALAQSYRDLYKDSPASLRAERLKALAALAPHRHESKLLMAEQHIALKEYDTARDILEGLMEEGPTARTFKAMAAAMAGLYGAERAQPWLEMAANAPLEAVPGAEGYFHFTSDGWRRLVSEYGDHERLAPPPLEAYDSHLTRDEVKLLTAPPPEPETSHEEALEIELVADTEEDIESPPPNTVPAPPTATQEQGDSSTEQDDPKSDAAAAEIDKSPESAPSQEDIEHQEAAIKAARLT